VPFAELLPLLFPFLRDIGPNMCGVVRRQVQMQGKDYEGASKVKLRTFGYDAYSAGVVAVAGPSELIGNLLRYAAYRYLRVR
jgi:hypothetical protein